MQRKRYHYKVYKAKSLPPPKGKVAKAPPEAG